MNEVNKTSFIYFIKIWSGIIIKINPRHPRHLRPRNHIITHLLPFLVETLEPWNLEPETWNFEPETYPCPLPLLLTFFCLKTPKIIFPSEKSVQKSYNLHP